VPPILAPYLCWAVPRLPDPLFGSARQDAKMPSTISSSCFAVWAPLDKVRWGLHGNSVPAISILCILASLREYRTEGPRAPENTNDPTLQGTDQNMNHQDTKAPSILCVLASWWCKSSTLLVCWIHSLESPGRRKWPADLALTGAKGL
jgi:hypothetical protein